MNSKFLIRPSLIKSTLLSTKSSLKLKICNSNQLINKNRYLTFCILNIKSSNQFDKKQTCFLSDLNSIQIRNLIRGGPGYTKFAHGRYKPNVSKFAYFWYTFLVGSVAVMLFFDFENFEFRSQEPQEKMDDFKKIYDRVSSSKAKEISHETDNLERNDKYENEQENDNEEDQIENKNKNKQTFRDRKIIQYENKIRQYSTPDKVFRYFATLKVWNEKLNDYEIFMSPEDFIRSLIFNAKQPEGLGLDSYNKYDPNMQKLEDKLDDDSVFKHLSKYGLISFSDYIFLVTLLSIPTRHFEIAFHMFDEDGNGSLDLKEFEELQAIIRSQTSLGKRHRDTHMTGSVIKENSILNEYFFGKDLNELLTVQKFIKFQTKLQNEVIRMEFGFCDGIEKDGKKFISEITFCEMILSYASLNRSKTKKMLKRISKLYNEENSQGISLEDYEEFFKVLRSLHDIDKALKFYTIAGASIDKDILKHVSKTVANAYLSDHVIDVIFNLFDENGDGRLSHKEFIKVMKKRWSRGLEAPKDTGFVKFVEAVGTCTKEIFF